MAKQSNSTVRVLWLCYMFFCVHMCDAYYIPISDSIEVYPLLVASSNGVPLLWPFGDLAQLQIVSSATVVSDRGVRFIGSTVHLRDLSHLNHSLCHVGGPQLCQTGNGSVIFPSSASQATIPDYAASVTDALTRPIAEQECARHARRVVHSYIDHNAYSVTLCDITQKQYQFVFNGATQTLYVNERSDTVLFYILLSFCVVVLVTCLAQDVSHLLGNEEQQPNPVLTTGCCIVLLLCTFVFRVEFITWSDFFYKWFLVAYISFSAVHWICRLVVSICMDKEATGAVPFNIVIGSLLLSLCHLYSGIECQYLLPLMFLLTVRIMHKSVAVFHSMVPLNNTSFETAANTTTENIALTDIKPLQSSTSNERYNEALTFHMMTLRHEWLASMYRCVLFMDCVLLAITHQYGFRMLYLQPYYGDAYFVVMVVFAMLIVCLVWERDMGTRSNKKGDQ